MGFELADVRRVLEAFEKSSWDEVHLSAEDFELHLVATSTAPHLDLNLSGQAIELSDKSALPSPPQAPLVPAAETTRGEERPRPAPHPEGAVYVTSPSLGIFWRAPRPGAPPFVDVGDKVTPDTTVCIVEVMKLMNHVKAEVTGRVLDVLAENGGQVEQGQALFVVLPEAL